MALDFTPSFANTFIIVYADEKKDTFVGQAFATRTQKVGLASISNTDEISQFSTLSDFNSGLSAVGQPSESFNPFEDSVPRSVYPG